MSGRRSAKVLPIEILPSLLCSPNSVLSPLGNARKTAAGSVWRHRPSTGGLASRGERPHPICGPQRRVYRCQAKWRDGRKPAQTRTKRIRVTKSSVKQHDERFPAHQTRFAMYATIPSHGLCIFSNQNREGTRRTLLTMGMSYRRATSAWTSALLLA